MQLHCLTMWLRVPDCSESNRRNAFIRLLFNAMDVLDLMVVKCGYINYLHPVHFFHFAITFFTFSFCRQNDGKVMSKVKKVNK
jgi:hypothetical protein